MMKTLEEQSVLHGYRDDPLYVKRYLGWDSEISPNRVVMPANACFIGQMATYLKAIYVSLDRGILNYQ